MNWGVLRRVLGVTLDMLVHVFKFSFLICQTLVTIVPTPYLLVQIKETFTQCSMNDCCHFNFMCFSMNSHNSPIKQILIAVVIDKDIDT